MRNDSKTINDENLCHYGSCSSNYDPKDVLQKQYWKGYVLMKDSPHVKRRNNPPGAFLPNETFPKIERIDSPDVKGSKLDHPITLDWSLVDISKFLKVFGSLLKLRIQNINWLWKYLNMAMEFAKELACIARPLWQLLTGTALILVEISRKTDKMPMTHLFILSAFWIKAFQLWPSRWWVDLRRKIAENGPKILYWNCVKWKLCSPIRWQTSAPKIWYKNVWFGKISNWIFKLWDIDYVT